MLAGETPFASGPEDSSDDILQRIGKGQYDMDSGNWQSVSSLAKNLGLLLLVIILVIIDFKFSKHFHFLLILLIMFCYASN